MRLACLILVGATCMLFPALAKAQAFIGGATAYTPEISTFTSGAVVSMQATVSADRKYVTLTARPTLTTLLQMQSVTFGPTAAVLPGFVGAPVLPAPANPARPANAAQPAPAPQNGLGGTILGRPGMTRLAPAP